MWDLARASPIGISTRVLIYQLRWYHRLNIAFLVCFEQMRYREVRTRICPQMFAKTTFVRTRVWILHLHTQEMGHNSSRGRPESVDPSFCPRDEQKWKNPLPELPKIGSLHVSFFHKMFVLGNEATFVPVWPDWLDFDGSEGAESIHGALVSHR